MPNFKVLTLVLFLAFSCTNAQYISAPQTFQDDVLEDLRELPTERSLNFLSVQLPQNKPEHEPIVQVKPFYIPVPLKDAHTRPTTYQTYQPTLMNYTPQLMSNYYSQHQEHNLNPYSFLYNSLSTIPSKHPTLFTPNKVFQNEYTNYVTQPATAGFIKYPVTQMPQYHPNFNYKQTLLNEPTFYNAPWTQQDLNGEENNFNENAQQYRVIKPTTIETQVKPVEIEPSIITVPATTPEILKPLSIKPPNQADSALLNLLQKFSSRRLVQERLGAVYFKDSLLNRK